jgi:hypothetical protein
MPRRSGRVRYDDPMHFTFTMKTKSGAVMTIEVDARDQAASEEKVKRENPTCTVMKVVTHDAAAVAAVVVVPTSRELGSADDVPIEDDLDAACARWSGLPSIWPPPRKRPCLAS